MKERILKENGIVTRHYAIDTDGAPLMSNAQMGAAALTDALTKSDRRVSSLGSLSAGTTGPDLPAPGLANQIQGLLRAPPLATLSVQGICAASIGALKAAAHGVELGDVQCAGVVGSEFSSRLFRKTRFVRAGEHARFDSHFLRWMLSDGAGALLLARVPSACPGQDGNVGIRLRWVHTRSFSGDLPNCMSIGTSEEAPEKSYLDYASLSEAEAAGAFLLRQDVRLLPNLFDLGMSELLRLARADVVRPKEVDHFLCHYSSGKFRGVVRELLENADVAIPDERWYSNLAHRGNTGAASMFIMLDEFLETRKLKPGEKILCFTPESGRFTVSYMLFEACDLTGHTGDEQNVDPVRLLGQSVDRSGDPGAKAMVTVLRDLNLVWHEYRSRVFRSPFARRILERKLTVENYLAWMENWIPQVRVGTEWMRAAVTHLPDRLQHVGTIVLEHAGEEQFDFKILFKDYVALGGSRELEGLRRNVGGEALHAFMMAMATREDSFSLLGGIYIIEGTGQRIIPTLLPKIRECLRSNISAYRFLQYHGENDVRHMQRWLRCLRLVLEAEPSAGSKIATAARAVAELYALQWELVQ